MSTSPSHLLVSAIRVKTIDWLYLTLQTVNLIYKYEEVISRDRFIVNIIC